MPSTEQLNPPTETYLEHTKKQGTQPCWWIPLFLTDFNVFNAQPQRQGIYEDDTVTMIKYRYLVVNGKFSEKLRKRYGMPRSVYALLVCQYLFQPNRYEGVRMTKDEFTTFLADLTEKRKLAEQIKDGSLIHEDWDEAYEEQLHFDAVYLDSDE